VYVNRYHNNAGDSSTLSGSKVLLVLQCINIPAVFGLNATALREVPFKLAGNILIKCQLNKTKSMSGHNWDSDCDVIVRFRLGNQKQESIMRARGLSEAFVRLPSKSMYCEKNF
jgi:hypothetical protein